MTNAHMKLGRRPPGEARMMALPLFPAFATLLPPPPRYEDWTTNVPAWGMMLNDTIGICTCADVGHTIQAMTAANGAMITPSDEDVLAMYRAVTGYDPARPETDRGAVFLDVLEHWRTTGLSGHLLGAYAKVRVGAHQTIKQAIHLCGAVGIGVQLPLCWQDAGDVWAASRRHDRDTVPGGWGGHQVPGLAYDAHGITVITWGKKVLITWAAVDQYVMEVTVPVSADWADADKAPNGYAYADLVAALDPLHDGRKTLA